MEIRAESYALFTGLDGGERQVPHTGGWAPHSAGEARFPATLIQSNCDAICHTAPIQDVKYVEYRNDDELRISVVFNIVHHAFNCDVVTSCDYCLCPVFTAFESQQKQSLCSSHLDQEILWTINMIASGHNTCAAFMLWVYERFMRVLGISGPWGSGDTKRADMTEMSC